MATLTSYTLSKHLLIRLLLLIPLLLLFRPDPHQLIRDRLIIRHELRSFYQIRLGVVALLESGAGEGTAVEGFRCMWELA